MQIGIFRALCLEPQIGTLSKKMTTIIRLIIITTLYASSINAKGMRPLAPPSEPAEPPNIGLFSLPSSQQPGPLISFGQTLVDKNNLQWLTIPTYLQETNHNSEFMVISTFVYGLTDSIALSLNVPYYVLNKIDLNHSSGVSDVGLNAEFGFFSASNSSYTTQATVLSTITLPSGSFDADPSLGLGALSYFIGTTFNRDYLNWWWFVSPGVTWISPHHDMHDGTVYFFQGGIGQHISSSANHYIFSGLLEFDGAYEGKAKIAGIDDPESGGYNILITPSLNYSAKNWQIQGGVSFPLLQQWNGDQPNINYLATVCFTLTLN